MRDKFTFEGKHRAFSLVTEKNQSLCSRLIQSLLLGILLLLFLLLLSFLSYFFFKKGWLFIDICFELFSDSSFDNDSGLIWKEFDLELEFVLLEFSIKNIVSLIFDPFKHIFWRITLFFLFPDTFLFYLRH